MLGERDNHYTTEPYILTNAKKFKTNDLIRLGVCHAKNSALYRHTYELLPWHRVFASLSMDRFIPANWEQVIVCTHLVPIGQ